MTTFGLVHGAYHGSWCWERLASELERLGHRVLTVDLPSDEPLAGAAEYAAVAATAFADCPAELAAWAASRLRGQFWKITSEMSPLSAWPGLPCAYLLGSRDPVINPVWSRRAARRVLGVQPVELDVGHSPFLAAPAL